MEVLSESRILAVEEEGHWRAELQADGIEATARSWEILTEVGALINPTMELL